MLAKISKGKNLVSVVYHHEGQGGQTEQGTCIRLNISSSPVYCVGDIGVDGCRDCPLCERTRAVSSRGEGGQPVLPGPSWVEEHIAKYKTYRPTDTVYSVVD